MKQIIIGITGGTGCGKTTALNALAELGFHIIDCDALYHDLLETDRDLLNAIEAAFPGVLLDGKLQRKVLGQRVFSNPDALNVLNQTVWPYVGKAVDAQIQAQYPQPSMPLGCWKAVWENYAPIPWPSQLRKLPGSPGSWPGRVFPRRMLACVFRRRNPMTFSPPNAA